MAIPRYPAYVNRQPAPAKEKPVPFDPATLTYDAAGLIPCVAQDHASGEVLMVAWMNAAAVAATLETGKVTYWSRSRQAFWVKGETSGHHQRLVELRVDCDRDCLLALVEQEGPACHTNRRSCFHTAIREGDEVLLSAPML
jgi:phosphoribosyl-AMP cyclohydrolase